MKFSNGDYGRKLMEILKYANTDRNYYFALISFLTLQYSSVWSTCNFQKTEEFSNNL